MDASSLTRSSRRSRRCPRQAASCPGSARGGRARFRPRRVTSANYTFKHALVRDAAHESLLRAQRQRLHGRIVQALEERFLETVSTEPELLAQHCTEAGLAEKAVDYWYKAGQFAIQRSATAEAIAQLTKGLGLLVVLPDGAERRRRELDLQLGLGPALIAAKGLRRKPAALTRSGMRAVPGVG